MKSVNSKILYPISIKGIVWLILSGSCYGLFSSFTSITSNKDRAILVDSITIDSVTSRVQDSTTRKEMRLAFCYENIKNYIFDNLHYPQEAIKKTIEGVVYVSFCIEADGKVNNVKIIRSVHPLLEQEAVRLIENMPHWKPIFYKNSPQSLSYTVPVIFELKD